MGYEAFVYLPANTSVSVGVVRELLKALVEEEALHIEGEKALVVRFGDWSVTIHLNRKEHVAVEAREQAEALAKNRPDKEEIAGCGVRLEVVTDDDEDMDHFNDYLILVEKLGELDGAKVLDLALGEFSDPPVEKKRQKRKSKEGAD